MRLQRDVIGAVLAGLLAGQAQAQVTGPLGEASPPFTSPPLTLPPPTHPQSTPALPSPLGPASPGSGQPATSPLSVAPIAGWSNEALPGADVDHLIRLIADGEMVDAADYLGSMAYSVAVIAQDARAIERLAHGPLREALTRKLQSARVEITSDILFDTVLALVTIELEKRDLLGEGKGYGFLSPAVFQSWAYTVKNGMLLAAGDPTAVSRQVKDQGHLIAVEFIKFEAQKADAVNRLIAFGAQDLAILRRTPRYQTLIFRGMQERLDIMRQSHVLMADMAPRTEVINLIVRLGDAQNRKDRAGEDQAMRQLDARLQALETHPSRLLMTYSYRQFAERVAAGYRVSMVVRDRYSPAIVVKGDPDIGPCMDVETDHLQCRLDALKAIGASQEAIDFSRATKEANRGAFSYIYSGWGWADSYAEFGKVDLVGITLPLRANTNGAYLLVNGNPGIVEVESAAMSKADATLPSYLRFRMLHPKAFLIAKYGYVGRAARPGGGQRFYFNELMADCRGCEILGTATWQFEFDARGTFLGTKLYNVTIGDTAPAPAFLIPDTVAR